VSVVPPPFQSFLEENRETVWRFLMGRVGPSEADDCFQETFIAALRAYPSLAVGREHNLRAWVLTIAHNKAMDAHRARARRALPQADPSEGRESSSVAFELPDEELWQAVQELPERQRSAVVLRFLGDLPHGEIATAMGCTEDAARRSLHEGLKKLRKAVPA
jgi:RNA polymerase sigma factor (sigma-70 family)